VSIQIQPTSSRGGTTNNTMAGLKSTLRLLEFQEVKLEDPKKKLFVRETI
jgi:hypothetical protein